MRSGAEAGASALTGDLVTSNVNGISNDQVALNDGLHGFATPFHAFNSAGNGALVGEELNEGGCKAPDTGFNCQAANPFGQSNNAKQIAPLTLPIDLTIPTTSVAPAAGHTGIQTRSRNQSKNSAGLLAAAGLMLAPLAALPESAALIILGTGLLGLASRLGRAKD